MSYALTTLSPADFEDLARDLASRELGDQFEAFAQGPDGGIDGRHATGGEAVILQAKHYAGQTAVPRRCGALLRLARATLPARDLRRLAGSGYNFPESRQPPSLRSFRSGLQLDAEHGTLVQP
jgi:hypothetical protein